MKLVLCVPALLLAGCAVSGSWLDKVGVRPNPPVTMSEEQAAALTSQARELRVRAETIRLALAAEKDRRQRFRYYEELRSIGDDLVPIETRLLDAGRGSGTASAA